MEKITTANLVNTLPALSTLVSQHAQAVSNKLTNNTTIRAQSVPPALKIPICDIQYVSPVKCPYQAYTTQVPDTSDEGNYNLKHNLFQIQATMAAIFTFQQENITNLQLRDTTLNVTNQHQSKEIKYLITTLHYISTRIQAPPLIHTTVPRTDLMENTCSN